MRAILLSLILLSGKYIKGQSADLKQIYETQLRVTTEGWFRETCLRYLNAEEVRLFNRSYIHLTDQFSDRYGVETVSKNDSFEIEFGLGLLVNFTNFSMIEEVSKKSNKRGELERLYFLLSEPLGIIIDPCEFLGVDSIVFRNLLDSNKRFKSDIFWKYRLSICFMYLHEIGHIMNGHVRENRKSLRQKARRNQEFIADKWAIKILIKFFIEFSRSNKKNITPRYLLQSISIALNYFFYNHQEKLVFTDKQLPEYERKLKILSLIKKEVANEPGFQDLERATINSFDDPNSQKVVVEWKAHILRQSYNDPKFNIEKFIASNWNIIKKKVWDWLEKGDDTNYFYSDTFNTFSDGENSYLIDGLEDIAYAYLFGSPVHQKIDSNACKLFEILAHASNASLRFDYITPEYTQYKIEEFNLICGLLFQYRYRNLPWAIYYYKRASIYHSVLPEEFYKNKIMYLANEYSKQMEFYYKKKN